MTQQYPHQPYQPPSYPIVYQAYSDPRSKFKRASVLMFVLAGIILLFGTCLGGASVMDFSQLPSPQKVQFEQLDNRLRTDSGIGLQRALTVAAMILVIPAIVLLGLGFGVRTGKPGWVIGALIVTGLFVLITAFMVLAGIVSMLNDPSAIIAVVVWAIPGCLFVLLLVWLIGCLRVPAPSQPWQQQGYWPAQQQMQYPPQQSYGYGHPTQQQPMPPVSGPNNNEEK